MTQSATAFAGSNIALVKYWGKSHQSLNIPATSSLSLTLDELGTQTRATLTNASTDEFWLDDKQVIGESLARVLGFLDLVREQFQTDAHFLIESTNSVPTAAGLASSASGFAALSLAVTSVLGHKLPVHELSILARKGSASAARSIFGGFSQLHGGNIGSQDSFAEPIETSLSDQLAMVIVQCAVGQKKISSRHGMNHTSQTSPYYQSWVDSHDHDMKLAIEALSGGDLETLGLVMEHSTLKMHATMLAANPPFWYFSPTTLLVLESVKSFRAEGMDCYFTMDAGPHVKVLCKTKDSEFFRSEFEKIAGVVSSSICRAGSGAHVKS